MKIIHNIAFSVDDGKREAFAKLDIHLDVGFTSFKIDESDARWPEIERLTKLFEAVDTVSTSFSAKELKCADYLRLVGSWHHGYPEPSEDFGYLSEVYSLDDYCSECGSGLVQKNPFKFSKEPKWGRKDMLQLNWVFDEFFVKPNVWEKLFKSFGIECREVLHAKSGKPLVSVVQLLIPEEDASFSLNCDYPRKTCTHCSITKFLPIVRGFFPALNKCVDLPIFKTRDIFGSGTDAHKAIIISHDLYSSLNQGMAKGFVFYPLEK